MCSAKRVPMYLGNVPLYCRILVYINSNYTKRLFILILNYFCLSLFPFMCIMILNFVFSLIVTIAVTVIDYLRMLYIKFQHKILINSAFIVKDIIMIIQYIYIYMYVCTIGSVII